MTEETFVDWHAYAVEQDRKNTDYRRRAWALNAQVSILAAVNTAFWLAVLLFDLMPRAEMLAVSMLVAFPVITVFAVRTAERFLPHDPSPR